MLTSATLRSVYTVLPASTAMSITSRTVLQEPGCAGNKCGLHQHSMHVVGAATAFHCPGRNWHGGVTVSRTSAAGLTSASAGLPVSSTSALSPVTAAERKGFEGCSLCCGGCTLAVVQNNTSRGRQSTPATAPVNHSILVTQVRGPPEPATAVHD